MAKVSPVSIKYQIRAKFVVEGSLEKPDVIGAIFGQTEGLLGADLDMRELQKEGKIGRIEVELERKNKTTEGSVKIPTALDQSETTLIAAAIETIDRIGPSDAQIDVEKIEDVRGSKRDYILERAKKLMGELHGSTDSREFTNELRDSTRTSKIQEYGKSKLPCGDLSQKEIIVVEGRADVVNLLKNGVDNVIAMNGTKLPNDIQELGEEKDLTLFVDGDRGGKLIIQNVTSNAKIKYIAIAPSGKEVEELTGKEILQQLRRKQPIEEFFKKEGKQQTEKKENKPQEKQETKKIEHKKLTENEKKKIKEISKKTHGTEKTVFLDEELNEIKNISTSSLLNVLKKTKRAPRVIVIDGTLTKKIVELAEELGVQAISASNFSTTSNKIKLLSF